MSTTVAMLKAFLTLDVSDFTRGARGAENDAERMGGRMSDSAKKFAMFGAAAVAAAVPVGMFLKGAIDNASDLAETVSKNTTIFGSAADELMTWASDAPKALGMTKNAALDATGTLGNLFTQLGVSTEAARKMSQANVELATDFASFHNANPEEVIEAMTAAYRGEFDAVQRFVPLLNAANVEEKALIMTKKSSKDALTAQDKALAVNAMMMEGAGAAAGDFARTSSGAANQARIAAASYEEMKTKIGNVLLPAWTALLTFVTSSFFPAMERLGTLLLGVIMPIWNELAGGIRAFAAAFQAGDGDITSSGFPGFMERVGNIARTVFDWLSANVPPALAAVSDAFSRAVEAVSPFWNTIKGNENLLITIGYLLGALLVGAFIALAAAAWSAAAGVIAATWPFIAIAAVIFGVITALRYAYENWEWFRTAVDTVVQWLQANVPPAFEAIKAAIAVVVDWVTGTAVPFLVAAFQSFMGFLQGTLLPAVSTVWNAIVAVITWVHGIVTNIVGRIVNFIADNFNWIAGLASAIWDQIKNVISNAWQIISNIIQLFLNIISGNWSGAWDNIKNILSAAVNMAIGTVENMGRVIGNTFMLIVSFAGNLLGGVGEKLGGLIQWFRDLPGKVLGALGDLGGLLLEAGKNILRGLIRGVESMIGDLKNKLSFVTNLIPSWKGPPVVDRKLLEPAGADIMGGLIRSIAARMPALRSQLAAVTAMIQAEGGMGGSIGSGIAAGIRGSGTSSLRGGPAGASGSAPLTVVVNGRARSEDGVAVVNAIAAWERVAGTTWRSGQEQLTASGW